MDTCATGHPRDAVDILQALLTPMIAGLATVIGCAQWWIARNKYRLDLFDRRWAVYIAARNVISAMFSHARTSQEEEWAFLTGIRGARWLFNDEIDRYLRKNMWPQICALNAANSMLADHAPPEEKPRAAKKKHEIMEWVLRQDQEIDDLFGHFLQTEQSFAGWIKRLARRGGRKPNPQ